MTRRKLKIYLIVIGVGLSALVAERMLAPSSTPASAKGAVENTSEKENPAGSTTDVGAELAVAPHAFPTMLPPLVPNTLLRDPFELPRAARQALTPSRQNSTEEVKSVAIPPSKQFLAAHRLSAIVSVGNSRVAVVDGLMIAVGQTVDDCRLDDLGDRSAQFTCADANIVLLIEPASLSP